MENATKALFTFAIVTTFIASLASLFGWQITQLGIVLQPWRTDSPLLFGLLLLFVGNFHYYTKIIEPAGETPEQTVLTLVGMVMMAALPIILVLEHLTPLRFFALTVYGALVVAKNYNLTSRFTAHDPLIYRIWTRRAILQTAICFGGAILFYVLMEPRFRPWLFDRFVDVSSRSFKPALGEIINLTFNLSFALVMLILYILHQKDLSDTKAVAVGNLPDLSPLKNEVSRRDRKRNRRRR
jgi:hypothetical protein